MGQSAKGGGIYWIDAGVGMTIMNSVVSGNSALALTYFGYGGGIYCNSFRGAAITNSIISGNSVSSLTDGYGGGILGRNSILTINNTVVAKNSAQTSADICPFHGGTISGSNNLIGDGTAHTSLVNGVNGNIVGTADNPIDPVFVDFEGGDYRLAAGSPAIDAGSNALAVDADGNPIRLDLDGNLRVFNGTVDIGAYEYGSAPPTPTEPLTAPTDISAIKTGATSVRVEWNEVQDASGYIVYWNETDTFPGPGVETKSMPVTALFYDVPDLTTGTPYYFWVIAKGDGVAYTDSVPSEYATATPSVTVTQLGTPNVTLAVNGTNSILVKWTATPNAPGGYKIEWSTQSGANFDAGLVNDHIITDYTLRDYLVENLTADTIYYLVENLTADTIYYFRVTALGDTINYTDSVAGTANAKTDKTTLTPPVDPIINTKDTDKSVATVKGIKVGKNDNKPTQTALTFNWTPESAFDTVLFEIYAPKPKGAKKPILVSALTVNLSEFENDVWQGTANGLPVSITNNSGTYTIRVSGLDSGTKYTVNMQAKTSDGKLSKVTKVSASTAKYAAPKKDGKVINIGGPGQVTFSWKQSTVIPAGMVGNR